MESKSRRSNRKHRTTNPPYSYLHETQPIQYRFLAKSMIERAILDCRIKQEQEAKSANWLRDLMTDPTFYIFEDTGEEFPSFMACCDLLNIAPELLRAFTLSYIRGEITMKKQKPFYGTRVVSNGNKKSRDGKKKEGKIKKKKGENKDESKLYLSELNEPDEQDYGYEELNEYDDFIA